ncbi:putative phage tail protein [Desulfobulbus elongatus]|uniref:putative phage tail protein n=1 Tax=Desulfobulbus elongatus TaxID=53332 RepID=UPI000685380A|nr:putative phage tail protein [Desulfobulbus elongatus]
MSLRATLQYLMPIELGGNHQLDLSHDARMLDAAMKTGESLLSEMFADSAAILLTTWERVYGLTAAAGFEEPLQMRRDRVTKTIRARGGLSIPYFINLAAGMGYAISIEEPIPSMTGWLCAGGELMSGEVLWQWGANVGGMNIYSFRAGNSSVGERLSWWPGYAELEAVFAELRPAHTFVYFNYEEE